MRKKMKTSNSNKDRYFMIDGKKYLLDTNMPVQELEKTINAGLNRIYDGLVVVHIDSITDRSIVIRYERTLNRAAASGCLFQEDASLITGLDVDCFTRYGNPLVRTIAFPGDSSYSVFISEIELLTMCLLEKVAHSMVRSVRIENYIDSLMVRILYCD